MWLFGPQQKDLIIEAWNWKRAQLQKRKFYRKRKTEYCLHWVLRIIRFSARFLRGKMKIQRSNLFTSRWRSKFSIKKKTFFKIVATLFQFHASINECLHGTKIKNFSIEFECRFLKIFLKTVSKSFLNVLFCFFLCYVGLICKFNLNFPLEVKKSFKKLFFFKILCRIENRK